MRRCWFHLLQSLLLLMGISSHAGGSGLNVVVVVNQNSANSVELGNYYMERRQVPPQNLLRINWNGGNVQWTLAEFTAILLNPFLAMVAERGLTNQVDTVVLSMDIPYRVAKTDGPAAETGYNSTTAVLYYGFKPNGPKEPDIPASCNLPDPSTNSYAGSESIFRAAPPDTATVTPFLTMMITSTDLESAKRIVDQGVSADCTFPPQPIYLSKSTDRLRNVRFYLFDDAVFNGRLLERASIQRTNHQGPAQLGYILGYQGGMAAYIGAPGIFAPGAMADQLTSYAGDIFEPVDQTSLLAMLKSGATASYGTVVEPCSYLEKFPSPQNYVYQARGFSVAESYYQSLMNPYQGLLVGEPLAAPFASRALGEWDGLPPNSLLAGVTNLSLKFTAAATMQPLGQIDLFVDGLFFQTLTNIGPTAGNRITVQVGGSQVDHTVTAGENLGTISAGLADAINAGDLGVEATSHGDRVELQGTSVSKPGSQMLLSVSSTVGDGASRTTLISASGSNFLDTIAYGMRSFSVTNPAVVGDYLSLLVIKTNGSTVVTSITNASPTNLLADLGRALAEAVNTNSQLQEADGVVIEDLMMHEEHPYNIYVFGTNDHSGEFNIRARSAGWLAAQAQVCLTGPAFEIKETGTNRLDENLTDLRPRAHLYLASGVSSLAQRDPVDTRLLPDGYHDLTAVAYEGTHVHTQKRVTTHVIVKNTTLVAELKPGFSGASMPVDSVLSYTVTAAGENIAKIDLCATGGILRTAQNQSSPVFSLPGSELGVGLHSIYAVVTGVSGNQYRTEASALRLVSPNAPFPVSIVAPPPTLSWPASPGKTYEVLGAPSLGSSWEVLGTLIATGSSLTWTDTNAPAAERYYRVKAVD